MSATETEAVLDFQKAVDSYMLHRVAICNSTVELPLLNIQDHFTLTTVTHTEISLVVYLEVMDAVADCKDTMMKLQHDLQQKFIVGQNMRWLALEGDAKLYEIVKYLKFGVWGGAQLAYSIPWGQEHAYEFPESSYETIL